MTALQDTRAIPGKPSNKTILNNKYLKLLDKVYKNIQEEIADVLNMVEQLEVYYGTEEIEDIRKEKIDRTMKLLREVNDERK